MSELLNLEKQFYERFWNLHHDAQLVSIFARFGYGPFRRSSVLEGFETFLIANGFSGECCIEIGTYKGLTAIVLARYFKQVVSIDIVPDPEKHRIVSHLGIKNIRFIDVESNTEKVALIGALEFDAAYVDGDHARDTRTDFDAVRSCGKVLFHEYWEVQSPVWALVNSLRSQGQVRTDGKLALWTA